MKVLDPGHRYAVQTLDDSCHVGDRLLQFVKREGALYPGNVGRYSGTNCQEVLRCVVDRLEYLESQLPCWQTYVATLLGAAMIWLLEHRAARRHGRRAPSFRETLRGSTCERCGHVGCRGECRR
jgi:hypothetical protein